MGNVPSLMLIFLLLGNLFEVLLWFTGISRIIVSVLVKNQDIGRVASPCSIKELPILALPKQTNKNLVGDEEFIFWQLSQSTFSGVRLAINSCNDTALGG